MSRLERLTAGQRLGELRKLELSAYLDQRIGAVIDRRNEIVHHLAEDPEVIRAMSSNRMDAVVTRFEQLALDAAALAAELHTVAGPKLEAGLGASQTELMQGLKEIDPKTIDDPLARRQVEAAQALGEIELSSAESEEVGLPEPPELLAQRFIDTGAVGAYRQQCATHLEKQEASAKDA